jgi:hypothetical protein
MTSFRIDPDDVLDYRLDYATEGWLAAGETITSHTAVASDGITLDSSTHDENSVTVWVSHAALRSIHEVTVHVVTSEGRERDVTLQFEAMPR